MTTLAGVVRMGFLRDVTFELRPEYERPFLKLVVGRGYGSAGWEFWVDGIGSAKVLRWERAGRPSGIEGRLLSLEPDEPGGKVSWPDAWAGETRAWRAMPALSRHQDCFLCLWEPLKCFKQRKCDLLCVSKSFKMISTCSFSNTHFHTSAYPIPRTFFLYRVYLSVSYDTFEV